MENQRVKLTKRLLKDSLVRLLQQKGLHEISVRELCDEAQINRSTFYKYYGSQYDLFAGIQADFLSYIGDSLDTGDALGDAPRVLKVLRYANENTAMIRLLIDNTVDRDFPQKLFSLPTIQARLTKTLSDEKIQSAAEREYLYQFIVNGAYSLIVKWIEKDTRESPEEITNLMLDFVTRVMR